MTAQLLCKYFFIKAFSVLPKMLTILYMTVGVCKKSEISPTYLTYQKGENPFSPFSSPRSSYRIKKPRKVDDEAAMSKIDREEKREEETLIPFPSDGFDPDPSPT